MQNIVMAIVEFSLDHTDQKFADLCENQLPSHFKRLIGLKLTLVKFKGLDRLCVFRLSLGPLFCLG